MLKRLTYRFPTDTQVRYHEHVPRQGERVTGLRGESYVVWAVREEEAFSYTVTCLRPEGSAR
jgi:hypothetical protein